MATETKDTLIFCEWKECVDTHCFIMVEMNTEEFPDFCFAKEYEAGVEAKVCAKHAIANACLAIGL